MSQMNSQSATRYPGHQLPADPLAALRQSADVLAGLSALLKVVNGEVERPTGLDAAMTTGLVRLLGMTTEDIEAIANRLEHEKRQSAGRDALVSTSEDFINFKRIVMSPVGQTFLQFISRVEHAVREQQDLTPLERVLTTPMFEDETEEHCVAMFRKELEAMGENAFADGNLPPDTDPSSWPASA